MSRREGGIEGYAEKYRAVIDWGETPDEQVGQRWDQVEPALWGRRRYSIHPSMMPQGVC